MEDHLRALYAFFLPCDLVRYFQGLRFQIPQGHPRHANTGGPKQNLM